MLHFFLLAVLKQLTGNSAEEAQLLEKIASGNENALSELYDLYSPLLFSLIKPMTTSQEEAEDLLQEIFLLIWDRAGSYDRTKGTPYGWIVALARNRGIDHTRSRRHKEQLQTDRDTEDTIFPILESDSYNPLDGTIARERSRLLKDVLSEIPSEQKEVIKIAYFGGFSQSEIAEKLNLPLGTVKTRMRQGMIKLKDLISVKVKEI